MNRGTQELARHSEAFAELRSSSFWVIPIASRSLFLSITYRVLTGSTAGFRLICLVVRCRGGAQRPHPLLRPCARDARYDFFTSSQHSAAPSRPILGCEGEGGGRPNAGLRSGSFSPCSRCFVSSGVRDSSRRSTTESFHRLLPQRSRRRVFPKAPCRWSCKRRELGSRASA